MINFEFDSERLSGEKKEREIYLAKRWNKSYKETVNENKRIFREMLEYLKRKNIRVIIITNPTTDFHKKYFPKIV